MNRLWRATINSWNGLAAVTRSEAAFRQELAVFAAAVPLALLLTPAADKRFLLIGSLVIVLIVELLNSALEKLCDRVTRQSDAAIGEVKDIASAAVGISLLLAAAVWLWVLTARFYG